MISIVGTVFWPVSSAKFRRRVPDVGPINEYPAVLTKMVTQLHTLFLFTDTVSQESGICSMWIKFFWTQFAGDFVGTHFYLKKMTLAGWSCWVTW